MKARTLVIGAAAAAAVYLYRTSRSTKKAQGRSPDGSRTAHTASEAANISGPGSTSGTARRVVNQIEAKSTYAPFPFNLILNAAAKLIGHRMDR